MRHLDCQAIRRHAQIQIYKNRDALKAGETTPESLIAEIERDIRRRYAVFGAALAAIREILLPLASVAAKHYAGQSLNKRERRLAEAWERAAQKALKALAEAA